MIRFIIHVAAIAAIIYGIAHFASRATGASYKFCIVSPAGEVMQKCWTSVFTEQGYLGFADSQANQPKQDQNQWGEK